MEKALGKGSSGDIDTRQSNKFLYSSNLNNFFDRATATIEVELLYVTVRK